VRLTQLVLLTSLILASGCGHASSAQQPSPLSKTCPGIAPAEREAPAAAYDAARAEVVVFGGDVARASVSDTLVYAGNCWSQVHTSVSPPPREAASLVYDPDVRLSILVGGRKDDPHGPQTIPGDVWTWDGKSWAQLSGAPQFSDVSAAYDEARHVVVVHGTTPDRVGTWTWDGSTWHLASGAGPGPRLNPAMCFDPSSNAVLLYGGAGAGTPIRGDTWLWNGATWSEQNPAHKPGPRFLTATTCGAHPLLFGGWGSYNGLALSDTWTWIGSDWQQLTATHTPTANTYRPFGVFDGTHQLLVTGMGRGQTWVWIGTDWASTT
jgi:hypothetical protein